MQKRHLRSVLRAQINLNPPYCRDEIGMLNSYEVNHCARRDIEAMADAFRRREDSMKALSAVQEGNGKKASETLGNG